MSCNREFDHTAPVATRSENFQVEYEHRIDTVLSNSFPIDSLDSLSIYLVETGLPSSIEGHTKTIIHKFSSVANYYSYAESKNVPAYELDQITDSLAYLAELWNMDSVVNQDGVVPTWWTEVEESVYSYVLFQEETSFQTRSLITQLNDDWRVFCEHGDRHRQIFTLPGIGFPVLGLLGWRNKVSGMIPLFIGGFDNIYQRSFYRRKLATIWSWGLTTTDFCEDLIGLNNHSNSWWSVGI